VKLGEIEANGVYCGRYWAQATLGSARCNERGAARSSTEHLNCIGRILKKG